ncbi:MAG: hypothetical protein U1F77_01780 [Kiritimatiellia bacterium]
MIFPPRRRPAAGGVDSGPVFLALFAAACCAVEAMHLATFARPGQFGWAALLPWLAWQHAMQAVRLGGWRSARAAHPADPRGACVAALAEPRAVRSSKIWSVVFALDVSDSIGDAARRKALEFITNSAAGKPEADRVGMVALAPAPRSSCCPARVSRSRSSTPACSPTESDDRPGAQLGRGPGR